MRIHGLHEQGFVIKAIRASYHDNNWSLNTLKTICHQIDEVYCKPNSYMKSKTNAYTACTEQTHIWPALMGVRLSRQPSMICYYNNMFLVCIW